MPPWWSAPVPPPDAAECREEGCWYDRQGFWDCHGGNARPGRCVLSAGEGAGPPPFPGGLVQCDPGPYGDAVPARDLDDDAGAS